MKTKLCTQKILSWTAPLLLSAAGLVACKTAEFTGGNRRGGGTIPVGGNEQKRPPVSEEAKLDPAGTSPNPTEAPAATEPVPSSTPPPNNFKYDPITDHPDKPGWADSTFAPKIKSIFDTGPGLPSSSSSPGTLQTPNPFNSPNTPGSLESNPPTTNDTSSADELGSGQDNAQSQAGVPGWNGDEAGTFWVPCNSTTSGGEAKGSITGNQGAIIRISGEFCPSRAISQISVLFVVDFSGSMTGPLEGPNDPTMAGTCGRLRAAEALVKKFDELQNVSLNLGMVGFSNDARLRLPFTDIASFRASLTTENWCGSDSNLARTNYRAAFEAANTALSNRSGDKVIYFVSDGSPTTGGTGGQSNTQAGLTAAQSLRNQYGRDLVLNAVFLGYRNGQAQNPQTYLESITGSAASVRLVSGANELVAAVTSFPITQDLIRADKVTGNLVGNNQNSAVGLAGFKRLNPDHRYIYVSQPIKLIGEPGSKTTNIVTFEAITDDGRTLTSRAHIEYIIDIP